MSVRKKPVVDVDFGQVAARVESAPLGDYLEKTFLVYAYETIFSRAIFSAEDGLKPVARRILWSMFSHGYVPSRNHVKSARIVGEVMSNFHPHGDSSIYEAMVRLAQPFSLRVPLVDGHGNFGFSHGDPAAAARYSEARLSDAALLLLRDIKENSVGMIENYDGTQMEPVVLPSAFPNLLINGGSGIATGIACSLPPHNPGEVIDAAKYLLAHPNASTERLMQIIPGPDFPTGGTVIGVDGIKEGYETGAGRFRIRGNYQVEPLPRGKHNIVFHEVPYAVSIEKIIDEIKTKIEEGKLQSVADVKDLSDRRNGTRFVVETKVGVNPHTLAEELFALTSLEVTFGINNTVLVAGKPQIVSLKGLLQTFLDHRISVVLNRSVHRRTKKTERLHLVEGLLLALHDIDKVIRIIRNSDTAAAAQESLRKTLKIDDIQADYILSLQLRRLTKLDYLELETEKNDLVAAIEELDGIIGSEDTRKKIVSRELTEVKKVIDDPRRTVIKDVTLESHTTAQKVLKTVDATTETAEETQSGPCTVWLHADGTVTKTLPGTPAPTPQKTASRIIEKIALNTNQSFIVVTSKGNAARITPTHLHADTPTNVNTLGLTFTAGETLVGGAPDPEKTDTVRLFLGTQNGVVKNTHLQDLPTKTDTFTVMTLEPGDEIVGVGWLPVDDVDTADVVFVSTDTSLLRTPASKIRAQGRSGGGMAGIKLSPNNHALTFAVANQERVASAHVVTSTGDTLKRSLLNEYPVKGRATGGVRSHTLRKNENPQLTTAIITHSDRYTLHEPGKTTAIPLPAVAVRRDATGTPQSLPAQLTVRDQFPA